MEALKTPGQQMEHRTQRDDLGGYLLSVICTLNKSTMNKRPISNVSAIEDENKQHFFQIISEQDSSPVW